jgi:hypothetical protein
LFTDQGDPVQFQRALDAAVQAWSADGLNVLVDPLVTKMSVRIFSLGHLCERRHVPGSPVRDQRLWANLTDTRTVSQS